MNDPRWDEPRPEYLADLDTVTFAPPGRPGRDRRPRRGLVTAATFVIGVAVGAGGVYAVRSPAPAAAQPIPTTTTVVKQVAIQDALEIQGGRVPERVDPRGSYLASCAASSGPGAAARPRLTASVRFDNRGNVGSSYLVKVVWYLLGGHQVTRAIRRNVPPGMTGRATINVPVPAAQVAANRRVRTGASCTTEVTLVGTFGTAYR